MLLRGAGQGVGRRPRRRAVGDLHRARRQSRCRSASSARTTPRPARRAARWPKATRSPRVRRPAAEHRERDRFTGRVARARLRRLDGVDVELTDDERDEIGQRGRAAEQRRGKARGHADSATTSRCRRYRADRRMVDDVASGTRVRAACADFRSTSSMPTTSSMAYVGFGLHLGTPVSQDADGTLLGHVRDRGRPHRSRRCGCTRRATPGLPHRRRRHHRAALPAAARRRRREPASRARPRSTTRSSARAPDLLDVLYEPMYWDRNDEQSPGEDPFFTLPGVQRRERHGRASSTSAGTSATRNAIPQVPRLTDRAARGDGPDRGDRERSRSSTSRWTSGPATSNSSTTP